MSRATHAPTATVVSMPTGRARAQLINQARHEQEQDIIAQARQLGMTSVNPQEMRLLELLRYTTYAGAVMWSMTWPRSCCPSLGGWAA